MKVQSELPVILPEEKLAYFQIPSSDGPKLLHCETSFEILGRRKTLYTCNCMAARV